VGACGTLISVLRKGAAHTAPWVPGLNGVAGETFAGREYMGLVFQQSGAQQHTYPRL